jgi:hypothetical protein
MEPTTSNPSAKMKEMMAAASILAVGSHLEMLSGSQTKYRCLLVAV